MVHRGMTTQIILFKLNLAFACCDTLVAVYQV